MNNSQPIADPFNQPNGNPSNSRPREDGDCSSSHPQSRPRKKHKKSKSMQSVGLSAYVCVVFFCVTANPCTIRYFILFFVFFFLLLFTHVFDWNSMNNNNVFIESMQNISRHSGISSHDGFSRMKKKREQLNRPNKINKINKTNNVSKINNSNVSDGNYISHEDKNGNKENKEKFDKNDNLLCRESVIARYGAPAANPMLTSMPISVNTSTIGNIKYWAEQNQKAKKQVNSLNERVLFHPSHLSSQNINRFGKKANKENSGKNETGRTSLESICILYISYHFVFV